MSRDASEIRILLILYQHAQKITFRGSKHLETYTLTPMIYAPIMAFSGTEPGSATIEHGNIPVKLFNS